MKEYRVLARTRFFRNINDPTNVNRAPGLRRHPGRVGKSTLIRCMNGLLKPSSGSVAVNGKDIGEYSANDLSEFIRYVPVTSPDCFSMPVSDTVLIGRYRRNKWRTGLEDIDATERTLKLLGLSDLAMHGFNELSAGQHQKVALARGLVREPEMLILPPLSPDLFRLGDGMFHLRGTVIWCLSKRVMPI